MNEIPLTAKGLSEDEKTLLRALCASAAMPILKKIHDGALVSLYGAMESATEQKAIFVLQGRIQGIRYMLNSLPLLSREGAESPVDPYPKGKKRQPKNESGPAVDHNS